MHTVIDELDEKILAELQRNSRASYRQLAKRVGVSPATLITRMARLERDKVVLCYSADLDYSRLGYEFTAVIEVTIRKGALLEVQKRIAHMPGVVSVYDVTGGSDSIVIARTKSSREFSRLVKKILAIDNVERTNTHVILNVLKEDYKLMPDLLGAEK